jgi:hypothetical protein
MGSRTNTSGHEWLNKQLYIYIFSRLREWFIQHENGHLTGTLVNGTFSHSLLFFFFVCFLGAFLCVGV